MRRPDKEEKVHEEDDEEDDGNVEEEGEAVIDRLDESAAVSLNLPATSTGGVAVIARSSLVCSPDGTVGALGLKANLDFGFSFVRAADKRVSRSRSCYI